MTSPRIIATSATVLILVVLLLSPSLLLELIEVGEEGTVSGLFRGEAFAPSGPPGFVGSLERLVHFSNGAPQRDGFCPKTDFGNSDKDFGI